MPRRSPLSVVGRTLGLCFKWLFSKRVVPTLKGVLAYELLLVLSFVFGYAEINPFPQSLASAVIVTIASVSGNTLGSCLMNTLLNLAGVLVGSFNFFVLAELAPWPVAQGVVFALMVYVLALVYAQGRTYLGFSLLGILQSFTGIFTSLAAPSPSFSGPQLRGYIQSYALGCACVLVVNICVLPRTSEFKLRKRLKASLGHARVLLGLVNRGYSRELAEDERGAMERLVLAVRADFGALNQLLNETAFEILPSRYSLSDLCSLVQHTHALQSMLIAAYYGFLTGLENGSIKTFRREFLPVCRAEFGALRGSLREVLREVERAVDPEPETEAQAEREGFGVEEEGAEEGDVDVEKGGVTEEELPEDDELLFQEMARRLRREVRALAAASSKAPSFPSPAATLAPPAKTALPPFATPQGPTVVDQQLFGPYSSRDTQSYLLPSQTHLGQPAKFGSDTSKSLRIHFDAFAQKLLDLQAHLLVSGGLSVDLTNDSLKLFQPMRSVAESWGTDRVRGVQEVLDREKGTQAYGIHPQTVNVAHRNEPVELLQGKKMPGGLKAPERRGQTTAVWEQPEDPDALRTGHSLVRVYSVLYALNKLTGKMHALHSEVCPPPTGPKRALRLRFHPLDALLHLRRKKSLTSHDPDLTLQEAICELEQTEYVPEKVNWVQRLLAVEHWFRRPDSVYAFKIVLALCVFSVLIWAPAVRGWFLSYALITALPNLVLALAPTLGATWLSFAIQILGTVIGNIWAMIVLLIFHNVGGYFYNPYGLACLMAVYAFPFAYCVHEVPEKYFLFGLLAMNSCGATIVMVYVNTVDLGDVGWNTPAFSAAIGLAALAVALGIVFCFQLLILRNPARHALRLTVARLIEDHLSYVTMLQAYIRALELVNPSDRPSPRVVNRVQHELKRREADLQERIITMDQLVTFAALEPNWKSPFKKAAAAKVLRANQLLIDRWSETLSAIGSEPFPLFVSQQFIGLLSPYRRQSFTTIKTSLYLAATSMASKIPLPIESPNPGRLTSDLVHDALLLSSRFAKTEEGRETVKSRDFARYWFFLLANMSANQHVADIENAIREIWGTFEDKVR